MQDIQIISIFKCSGWYHYLKEVYGLFYHLSKNLFAPITEISEIAGVLTKTFMVYFNWEAKY